jgi:hypothetical protein
MISDEVKRFAEIHDIDDMNKATSEFFKIYPEKWAIHKAEVTTDIKNQSNEDRERERAYINSKVDHEIYMVALGEKLDLEKREDMVKAATIAARNKPELFERQRQANSVQIGKTALDPLTDG